MNEKPSQTDQIARQLTGNAAVDAQAPALPLMEQLRLTAAVKRLNWEVIGDVVRRFPGALPGISALTSLDFQVAIHHLRTRLITSTLKERQESEEWLRSHGRSPSELDRVCGPAELAARSGIAGVC